MTYFSVEAISIGKQPERNEDYYGWNEHRIVLSDGATDRTGIRYELDTMTGAYKTGGEVASRLVVKTALGSHRYGKGLVREITSAIQHYYRNYCPEALTDTAKRFSASLLVVTLLIDEARIEVLQIADSPFRVNETTVYENPMLIDAQNIAKRQAEYQKTHDIAQSNAAIIPSLKVQHLLQNNAADPLGYGAVDGGDIPEKFIKLYTFPLKGTKIIELASDGYYGQFPKHASVEAFESMITRIHADDPYKVGQYASIKPMDDRTAMVVTFKS